MRGWLWFEIPADAVVIHPLQFEKRNPGGSGMRGATVRVRDAGPRFSNQGRGTQARESGRRPWPQPPEGAAVFAGLIVSNSSS